MSRESVALALYNQISSAMITAGAVKVSRRLLHWSDVEPADQPAVFVAQGTQEPTWSKSGEPIIWRWNFSVYIYAHEADPTASPSSKLNVLLDALEGALAPEAFSKKQTLGGTVVHCWINGAVETDEGILGSQCMAIVPIEILVTT